MGTTTIGHRQKESIRRNRQDENGGAKADFGTATMNDHCDLAGSVFLLRRLAAVSAGKFARAFHHLSPIAFEPDRKMQRSTEQAKKDGPVRTMKHQESRNRSQQNTPLSQYMLNYVNAGGCTAFMSASWIIPYAVVAWPMIGLLDHTYRQLQTVLCVRNRPFTANTCWTRLTVQSHHTRDSGDVRLIFL